MAPRREHLTPVLLSVILACAAALRLWGIRNGLPYAYDVDERAHYVPQALRVVGGDLDPRYFVNPPAYTYVLGATFGIVFGADAQERYAADPSSVLVTARLLSAGLGVGSVAATYAAGRAWLGPRTGLLAAALVAVAFLPAFYARLGLGDAASVLVCALALWAAADVARSGRARAYAAAGALAGLAAATKYSAGIVLLLVPCAALLAVRRDGRRRTAAGVALGCLAALAAFLLANPYSLLDWHTFIGDLHRLRRFTVGPPLIGQVERNGWVYYLASFGWGLGLVPAVAALAGLALLVARRRPQAVALVPLVVCFLLYMGHTSRFYARWMLPVYPVLAILAGHAGGQAADAMRRVGVPRAAATTAIAAVLILPALLPTVRNARALARTDTRSQTRAWLVAHVPPRSRVVFEPLAPEEWYGVTPGGGPKADPRRQWHRFHRTDAIIAEQARTFRDAATRADFLNYERTLSPPLVTAYERRGYCWVVTGSTQSGQALAEPHRVPEAVAYYRRLRRESRVAFRASPLAKGARLPRYQFDRSFNAFDAAYQRTGPLVVVYRLRGGRCAARRARR